MIARTPQPTGTPQPSGTPQPTRGVSWKSVALPTEHGGWSLTAESALLGLLVAWSLPGLALGVAAMLAFMARTPAKLVLVDRFRHRWLPRTRLAAQVATVELVVLLALVAYSMSAGDNFWAPLAVAAPLVLLELWYDTRSRSRRLVPELAGSVGIGAIATAIALADGAPGRVAWGLWIVIAARSVAAIPYVRGQILRTKSRPAPTWHSDAAQIASVVAVSLGWILDLVPVAAVVAIAVLAIINLVATRLPPKPAVVIGVQQTIFGFAVILTTAIALN